jgi:hypothetical protein
MIYVPAGWSDCSITSTTKEPLTCPTCAAEVRTLHRRMGWDTPALCGSCFDDFVFADLPPEVRADAEARRDYVLSHLKGAF